MKYLGLLLAALLCIAPTHAQQPVKPPDAPYCTPEHLENHCKAFCTYYKERFAGEMKINFIRKEIACLCMPLEESRNYRRQNHNELFVWQLADW